MCTRNTTFTDYFLFWSCFRISKPWEIPERYAAPGAPRLFSLCEDSLWCRWSVEWSRMSPLRLHYPGAGWNRSASETHGRSFCRQGGKKTTVVLWRCWTTRLNHLSVSQRTERDKEKESWWDVNMLCGFV